MNFKIVLCIFLFLLSINFISAQTTICSKHITNPATCTVDDNCLATVCGVTWARSAPIIQDNGGTACTVGAPPNWYCMTLGSNKFIVPEFGMIPRLITFLSSLGIPYWLFRRKK